MKREEIKNDKKNAREEILLAADAFLKEEKRIEAITMRRIAERAGVGLGLINYYFKSRDALLAEAIGRKMKVMIQQNLRKGNDQTGKKEEPYIQLNNLLEALSSFSLEHEELMRFAFLQNIQNGDRGAELSLVPVLRQIFTDMDEMQLRLLAIQMIAPLQIAAIAPKEFLMYSGKDIHKEEERRALIQALLLNLKK